MQRLGGLKKVFEMRFGTYEASYDNLPRMLEAIVQRNPESAFDTYSVPSLSGGPSILLRAFFCIGACVRAFIYCLSVLCIDGIEKYWLPAVWIQNPAGLRRWNYLTHPPSPLSRSRGQKMRAQREGLEFYI